MLAAAAPEALEACSEVFAAGGGEAAADVENGAWADGTRGGLACWSRGGLFQVAWLYAVVDLAPVGEDGTRRGEGALYSGGFSLGGVGLPGFGDGKPMRRFWGVLALGNRD